MTDNCLLDINLIRFGVFLSDGFAGRLVAHQVVLQPSSSARQTPSRPDCRRVGHPSILPSLAKSSANGNRGRPETYREIWLVVLGCGLLGGHAVRILLVLHLAGDRAMAMARATGLLLLRLLLAV